MNQMMKGIITYQNDIFHYFYKKPNLDNDYCNQIQKKITKKSCLLEMSCSMETITLGDKRIGIKTGVLEENITQMPSGSVF